MNNNSPHKIDHKRKIADATDNEATPLAKQFRRMTTKTTVTKDQKDETQNPMDQEKYFSPILPPKATHFGSFITFPPREDQRGSITGSPENFLENEKGGRETLLSEESMDCEDVRSPFSGCDDSKLDDSLPGANLSCNESLMFDSDEENPVCPRGSFIFCSNSNDGKGSKVLSLQEIQKERKPKNSFFDLPDEIILCIFKKLPYTWKQLLGLRRVCKEWARLLADSSLKYGRHSEDLEVMIQNEEKHFSPLRDYLSSPQMQDINGQMRAILVGWLGEVTQEFNLDNETLFIAVHLLDRYLSLPNRHITRGRLQLLGVTSLLVAAKHEEIYAPTVSDLVYMSDNAYSKEEIKGMEINLLNALKFDITVCTSRRFLHYYLKAMGSFLKREVDEKTITKMAHFADYILESSLSPYDYVLCAPSFISAAVVYLVFHNFELEWCAELESETHHSIREITPLVRRLHSHIQSVSSDPLNMVHIKYSQAKFDSVANLSIRDLSDLEQQTSLTITTT